MKKIFFALIITTPFLFQMCAKEKGPNIQLTEPKDGLYFDSTYIESTIPVAEAKRVLIEEFSGVRCVNCYTGHTATENIIVANPGRAVGVTLHVERVVDPSTNPFHFANAQDFQTKEATAIDNLLGPYGFTPCAGIDRVVFAGEPNAIVSPVSKWTGYTAARLAVTSPVNIILTNTWNAADRSMDIKAELHYTAAVSTPQNFSLMIVEDSIINPQTMPTSIKPSGIDTFYTNHHNILRKMLTDATGKPITIVRNAGSVQVYKLHLNNVSAAWKEDHLNIIGIVHGTGATKDVAQVVEKKLK